MVLLAHILLTAAVKASKELTPGWLKGVQTTCKEGGRWWRANPDRSNGVVQLYCGPDPANFSPFATIPINEVPAYVRSVLQTPATDVQAFDALVTEPTDDEPEEQVAVTVPSEVLGWVAPADEVQVGGVEAEEQSALTGVAVDPIDDETEELDVTQEQ